MIEIENILKKVCDQTNRAKIIYYLSEIISTATSPILYPDWTREQTKNTLSCIKIYADRALKMMNKGE